MTSAHGCIVSCHLHCLITSQIPAIHLFVTRCHEDLCTVTAPANVQNWHGHRLHGPWHSLAVVSDFPTTYLWWPKNNLNLLHRYTFACSSYGIVPTTRYEIGLPYRGWTELQCRNGIVGRLRDFKIIIGVCDRCRFWYTPSRHSLETHEIHVSLRNSEMSGDKLIWYINWPTSMLVVSVFTISVSRVRVDVTFGSWFTHSSKGVK